MRGRGQQGAPISLFSFQDIITSVSGIIILMTLLLALELVTRKMSPASGADRQLADALRTAIEQAQVEAERLRTLLESDAQDVTALAGTTAGQLANELHELDERLAGLAADAEQIAAQAQTAQAEVEVAEAERFDRQGDAQRVAALQKELQEIEAKLAALASGGRRVFSTTAVPGKETWLVQIESGQALAGEVGVARAPHVMRGDDDELTAEIVRWARTLPRTRVVFVLFVKPTGIMVCDSVKDTLLEEGYDVGFDVMGAEETVVDPQTGAGTP